jgi:formiminotetrahydrofolate cyclodeaminase
VLSDVVVAAHLALAALHSAGANVEVNLPALRDDPFASEARTELKRLFEGRRAQVDVILARAKHRGE